MRRFGSKLFGLVIAVAFVLTSATSALAQPSNDDISSATSITPFPFTDIVDTTTATTAAGDPTDCDAGGESVWYSFAATSDQPISIDTFGSDYDTVLGVYTGSPGSLTLVDCNDQAGDLDQSQVLFNAVSGTTYYVVVTTWVFASGGGNLVLNADVSPVSPLELGVTVDARGSVTPKTGTATVSGTVECSEDTAVELEVFVSQRIGRSIVQGGAFDVIDCTAPSSAWSLQIQPFNGLFVGGRVTVEAFVFGCGEGNCDSADTTRTVRLRGRG